MVQEKIRWKNRQLSRVENLSTQDMVVVNIVKPGLDIE